jgi:hypothetical protein
MINERLEILDRVKIAHGGLGRELLEDGLHLVIVGDDGSPLPQIAGGARQSHIAHRGLPSPRSGNDVVQMVRTSSGIEELEDASLGDGGAYGSESTVDANSPVAFGDSVADCGGNVPCICHSVKGSMTGCIVERMCEVGR